VTQAGAAARQGDSMELYFLFLVFIVALLLLVNPR
jgi:hypothetical protein